MKSDRRLGFFLFPIVVQLQLSIESKINPREVSTMKLGTPSGSTSHNSVQTAIMCINEIVGRFVFPKQADNTF